MDWKIIENTFRRPFENETHVQLTSDGEAVLKPYVYLTLPLIRDLDGYGFGGDPYKIDSPTVQFHINDHGKLRIFEFNLTKSGSQQVTFSDTQIYPSFSFKDPRASETDRQLEFTRSDRSRRRRNIGKCEGHCGRRRWRIGSGQYSFSVKRS